MARQQRYIPLAEFAFNFGKTQEVAWNIMLKLEKRSGMIIIALKLGVEQVYTTKLNLVWLKGSRADRE